MCFALFRDKDKAAKSVADTAGSTVAERSAPVQAIKDAPPKPASTERPGRLAEDVVIAEDEMPA